MIAFFIVLAIVTGGVIWATETVDRPHRAEARRARLATTTPR